MVERVQKVLANAGLGSRRELERMIEAGRVKINGRLAKLGDKVDADDKVSIDGRKVNTQMASQSRRRVLVYHKKEGEVCTRSDPDGRPTIFDNIPKIKGERWVAIGRLDINTSGLLLLTTDGEFANKLMHPSFQVPREYAVRVRGHVTEAHITALTEGVLLEDGMARFNDIVYSGGENQNQWYHVVLLEGRNREVRRLWESQGLTVSRLKRVRYGTIVLTQRIRQGSSTELNEKEIASLEDMLNEQDKTSSNVEEKPAKKATVKPNAKRISEQAAKAKTQKSVRKASIENSASRSTNKPANKSTRATKKVIDTESRSQSERESKTVARLRTKTAEKTMGEKSKKATRTSTRAAEKPIARSTTRTTTRTRTATTRTPRKK